MSFPNLSALAVRERSVTLFFLLIAGIAGVFSFLALGRAEDPAFTVRAMVVTVVWPGATPQELQSQVVDRLEKRVQEVPYLYRMESTIRSGQASLQIEFEDYAPNSRIPDLFYQVRKRMEDESHTLPPGVIGPIVNDDFSDVYFTLVSVTAPGMPMRELTLVMESMRDRLQHVEGVQKALILGERTERMFVEFNQEKLVNLGLSPQAVFEAIDASNRLVPSGKIETQGPRAYLRLDADLSDPKQIESLPIRVGTKLIRLSDVALVRRGYEDPPSYLVRSRGEDAMLLGTVMAKGENGQALGKRLDKFIEAERSRMPLGMTLEVLTNQAEAIDHAVDLFQIKFLVAVIVVIGVSVLALGLRAGLIVGIAVPFTLGISFLIMMLLDINLDRITLGALIIALGLLVDDAIISVEMMLVKMAEGWDRVRAAAHAWTVTAAPMLLGTLVTVAGFFPIGFAKSAVGEYAGNIFWVLAITLVVSWFVAVTFVPYLGVKLLPALTDAQAQAHHGAYHSPLYQRLRRLITWCVVWRKSVVVMTVALLVLSVIGMVVLVHKQFFPNSDRTEVLISVYQPQGSGIAATDKTIRKIETLLAPMPEVKSLSSYVGAGAPRFFISATPEPPDPAFGKIIAVARDTAARDKIIALVKQHIAAGEYSEARVRPYRLLYGPPVVWPVTLRVVGPDPVVLRKIAHQVRDVMTKNPHLVDPHLEWDERAPTLHLSTDAERLSLLGMTPMEVSQQLQFLLDGATVTQLRQDLRSVDLVARGIRSESGLTAERLGAEELITHDGRKVPLAQLGRIEVRYEDPVIKRYNREGFLAVFADIQGAEPNDVTDAVWLALADVRSQLPAGYRIDVAGSVEQSGKADLSIQKLQPAMAAFMMIFIMIQMRSFKGTFVVLATAPLGLMGAVLALLLFRQPFGFVALLGLIGLAGILMRNTLILTQQISDNDAAGMAPFEGVVEAAVQRARPVILTAFAAVFAFIPLTHDSLWGALAYVLIGGVAVGTVITLLFVPALYAIWFKREVKA